MANKILLYPTLTDELMNKIRFQKQRYKFYYTDKNEDEFELVDEPVEAFSIVNTIKDENGIWTQDDYNIAFRRKYCLRTFNCLFGENGIVCHDSKLGLAIQWTSSDSHQRGIIKVGEFGADETIIEVEAEKEFKKAQLRGEVTLTTVLYISQEGHPNGNEKHLANTEGFILGELDNYVLKLDGSSSVFPVFEVSEPGQPLWYIKCDWLDPTVDLFSECISINLNTAHKNYVYIDRNENSFVSQLLVEIMSSAVTQIIEKVRLEQGYWEQIMQGEDLESGSIGQAIYYFMNTLEWDLTSPDSISLSARKFFDQRI